MHPKAQRLSQVFKEKGEVQAYPRQNEIEWTSISCGMWMAWSIPNKSMGTDVEAKRILDDGEGCLTEENMAMAIARALTIATEETRNRNGLLQDFSVSQNELLAEVEMQTESKFGRVDSGKLAEEKVADLEVGIQFAQYPLINIGFMTGTYGGFLKKEGKIMNERLGLQKTTLEKVVAAGLARIVHDRGKAYR